MLNWNDVTTQVIAAVIAGAILGLAGLAWARHDKIGPWLAARPWAVAIVTALPVSIVTTLLAVTVGAVLFGLRGHPGAPGPKGDPGPASGVGVPSGGVVAFDLPGGCPSGWADFKKATTRMIVGASDPNEHAFVAPPVDFTFGAFGGDGITVLTKDNLPKVEIGTKLISLYVLSGHRGDYQKVGVVPMERPDEGTYKALASIGGSGEGQSYVEPIKMFPPFIALYYCEKKGT